MISIFDHGPHEPCPDAFNYAEYVLRHTPSNPEKIGLITANKTKSNIHTYNDLSELVTHFASRLKNEGLNSKDVALMKMGNTIEFPIAFLATLSIGAVPVPTSAQLTPSEFEKITTKLSPKAVLVSDPNTAISEEIQHIELNADKKRQTASPLEFHMGDPNRLGYIVYTSGTSGQPTAVMHAHRAIWARRMMHRDWYDLQNDDRVLHAGAFNWTFTLGTGLMDPWSVGATSIIPETGFGIQNLPSAMREHEATIFAAAPGVYRKLLNSNMNLSSLKLRHGLCAGEKLSEDLRKAWQDATGVDLHEAFGMSECSTFISGSPKYPAKPGTLGRPQTGRRVAIIDDKGPTPFGTAGTIAVHKSDPGLMLGYHNTAKETASKFQGDWFLTGDLGEMDKDGNITYLGRSDDMMNAGGFRVSPIEVEDALRQHPQIDQLLVTDVEIKANTRVIAAFYTSSSEIDETDLNRFANSGLARYKQPRIFQRVETLPTNANGKLSRRSMQKIFEAQYERPDQT